MNAGEMAQVLTIIVPLALYFGFLGAVNIRRRPTVVSGRLDFIVVILVFLPLLYGPLRMVLTMGGRVWQGSVLAAVGVVLWLLLPREFSSVVVYSVSRQDLTRSLERILRRLGVAYVRRENRIECTPPYGTLVISSMPLLRNVTIYPEGTRDTVFLAQLGQELHRDLNEVESRPSLSGHCFIAVAVTLLLTPLIWVAHAPVYAWLRRWLGIG